MSNWIPRTTSPAEDNPYYVKYPWGYNYCIEINGYTHSCLPNCVGYAWGRFIEGVGETYSNLSRGNASSWWGNTGDGYQRGQVPQVGAVVCYGGGSYGGGGYGHVGIVESINPDGTFEMSQSSAGGTWWFMSHGVVPGQNRGNLTWQGFIYNPWVTGVGPDPGPDPGPEGVSLPIWMMLLSVVKRQKRRAIR